MCYGIEQYGGEMYVLLYVRAVVREYLQRLQKVTKITLVLMTHKALPDSRCSLAVFLFRVRMFLSLILFV